MKLLALPILLALSAHAWADAADDDCAKQRAKGKTCKLSIEEETVEGGVVKNTETPIIVNVYGRHGSLIHVRQTFIPEIIKSAEDL